MSTTSIRRVSHSAILLAPNAPELIAEYAAECSVPEIGQVNVQPEAYAALEAAGLMSFFGVYSGAFDAAEAPLVGFATMLVTVHPDYGRLVATVKLFLTAPYRASHSGRTLMSLLDQHATEAGCVAIVYTAKAGSRFARVLEASHTYTCTNVVYCRSLA